jgi:[methyl-Co(III) methanol-specific corrinoid protein]:coenzyme M methyltransferase
MKNSRREILSLLHGQTATYTPLFSGLINVTEAGLESEGLQFYEVHRDAAKMARAAASTYQVSGFGSAVVPLDLCVEAEALGARVDFREDSERAEYPRVAEFLYDSMEKLTAEHAKSAEKKNKKISLARQPERAAGSALSAVNQGRIPIVCEAIRLLKADAGNEIVIGAWVPGPFTLLSLLVETGALYLSLRKSKEQVHAALEILTQVLASVGNAYHEAGADFLTVHEMGGSPGALGPKLFENIVLPHLKTLFSELPRPAVLSACGRTNGIMHLLAASGADALSVDQTNDLAASREEVPDALLFGNLDPVGLISQGTPDEIAEAVASVVRSGADAVWPGCDLYPDVPLENLRALVEASKNLSV